MPKINILDSNLYNRISAGEVVERPASIVKELVENCLDAGATSISVEIKGGGIAEIRVTDNGCGMEYSDLETAFLPHATSKISDASDLDQIQTLGFRGEALASIAAVSMVLLKSKQVDSGYGGEIEINGGKIERYSEAATANGTQLTVRNLFFNTPARAKFLRKPKQEETEITNLMARFILVHANISFRYIVEEKEVYHSNATDLADAIYIVYGRETFENMIPVENVYQNMKISGYIGKPTFTKPNKTYQTVSLNGRYIINSTIASAVHNVYAEYLMKRTYPFYVLALEMPYDCVDVNVHPNKMDVRFENSGAIYSFLFNAVGHAINRFNREQIDAFNAKNQALQPAGDTHGAFGRTEESGEYLVQPAIPLEENPFLTNPILKQPQTYPSCLRDSSHFSASREQAHLINAVDESGCGGDAQQQMTETEQSIETPPEKTEQQSLGIPENYRVLGQLFQSYILLECGDELLMIDQHAAHERLLFDRLEQTINAGTCDSQSLLIPYVFTLNPLEKEYFQQQVSYLSEIGFSIEEFGSNAYRISAVPYFLNSVNLQEFVDDILSDFNAGKRVKTSESVRDILAQKACKAAVKAGMSLEDSEIRRLLQDMRGECVLQCPHGRPVIYTITKKDIEKWFKRIV